MSDSDDDVPLFQRQTAAKETTAAVKPQFYDDDSDDDVPIAVRQVQKPSRFYDCPTAELKLNFTAFLEG